MIHNQLLNPHLPINKTKHYDFIVKKLNTFNVEVLKDTRSLTQLLYTTSFFDEKGDVFNRILNHAMLIGNGINGVPITAVSQVGGNNTMMGH